MGLEATCHGEFGDEAGEGKLQLEGGSLLFRGPFRLKVDLKTAKVDVEGDVLKVIIPEGQARFRIGPKAAHWKEKILNPPGLLDKLGVKPGSVISLAGLRDVDVIAQIEQRGATVSRRLKKESDLILFSVEKNVDLKQVPDLIPFLKATGGIWFVYPKGLKVVTEAEVRSALLGAGLVDTKVCSYSPTHTGLKGVFRCRTS